MPDEPDIDAPDSEERERDTVWSRWAKFVGIIFVAAGLLGFLFGISIHVVALFSAARWMADDSSRGPYHSSSYHRAQADINQSNRDTPHAFKVRIIIGSVLGAGCGLAYVVRCLVRNEDP